MQVCLIFVFHSKPVVKILRGKAQENGYLKVQMNKLIVAWITAANSSSPKNGSGKFAALSTV